MSTIARSGAEAFALAMGEQAARWKAESLAARDAELAELGREIKARMMRDLDARAARMKEATLAR